MYLNVCSHISPSHQTYIDHESSLIMIDLDPLLFHKISPGNSKALVEPSDAFAHFVQVLPPPLCDRHSTAEGLGSVVFFWEGGGGKTILELLVGGFNPSEKYEFVNG